MSSTAGVNIALGVILVLTGAIGAVVATRPTMLLRSVARRAELTQLPLGSPDIVDALVVRARTFARTTGIVVVIAGLTAAAVGIGPLGDTPLFFLGVIALTSIAVAATFAVATIVDRPFPLRGDAQRLARSSARRSSDYIGPARRWLPWVLTAASAIVVVILLVRGEAGGLGVGLTAVAVAAVCILPVIDRAVVTAPQFAQDPVQLAWDEAFRADALGAVRATTCLLALTGGALALPADTSWVRLGLNLAILAVVMFYARSPWAATLLPSWLAATTLAGRR